MNTISFTKMHGLGNDYIYIDCLKEPIPENQIAPLAIKLSKPHFGIGSDGLILICPASHPDADFKMRMFNADGSEGKMCGNGIRCVGKYLYDNKLTDKVHLTIETLSGLKKLALYPNVDNLIELVEVDMGEAVISQPVKIMAGNRCFTGTPVNMGNPHVVIWVDDVDTFDIQKYGPLIENNLELFPDRVNAEFIQIDSTLNTIKMRVWERGSGETMACGTGACAVFASAYHDKKVSETATIQLLGGTLAVSQRNGHILMKGPAETVFSGQINTKNHIF